MGAALSAQSLHIAGSILKSKWRFSKIEVSNVSEHTTSWDKRMHSSLEIIFCHDGKLQSIYDISAIMNRNQTGLCRYWGRLEFVSKFEYVLDFKLRFELIKKVLMGLQVILNPAFSGIFFFHCPETDDFVPKTIW